MARYRTEISFKRHHELPRASATPGRGRRSRGRHRSRDPRTRRPSKSTWSTSPRLRTHRDDSEQAESTASTRRRERFRSTSARSASGASARSRCRPTKRPEVRIRRDTRGVDEASPYEVEARSERRAEAQTIVHETDCGRPTTVVAVHGGRRRDPSPEDVLRRGPVGGRSPDARCAEAEAASVPFYKREISFRRKRATARGGRCGRRRRRRASKSDRGARAGRRPSMPVDALESSMRRALTAAEAADRSTIGDAGRSQWRGRRRPRTADATVAAVDEMSLQWPRSRRRSSRGSSCRPSRAPLRTRRGRSRARGA